MSRGATLRQGTSVKRSLLQLAARPQGLTFAEALKSQPGTTKASMTSLIKQLRASGFVLRDLSIKPALYTATPDGRSALDRVTKHHPQHHQKLRGPLTKRGAVLNLEQPVTISPTCVITRIPTPAGRFAADPATVGAFSALGVGRYL